MNPALVEIYLEVIPAVSLFGHSVQIMPKNLCSLYKAK